MRSDGADTPKQDNTEGQNRFFHRYVFLFVFIGISMDRDSVFGYYHNLKLLKILLLQILLQIYKGFLKDKQIPFTFLQM